MTELINKEELLRRFADFGREIPKDIVIGVIASVKEEVVRCKDCKHSDKFGCHNPIWVDGWANYPSPITKDTDFCSFGDREGEEIQGLEYAENILDSILREQEVGEE
jgi:hypothetical protein